MILYEKDIKTVRLLSSSILFWDAKASFDKFLNRIGCSTYEQALRVLEQRMDKLQLEGSELRR